MKLQKLVIVFSLALVGRAGAASAQAGQASPSTDPSRQGVVLLRVVNTVEANRAAEPFDPLSAVVATATFRATFPAATLSNPSTAVVGDRTLVLIVSDDRKHYQAMVSPAEKCGVATFTNETGLIYSGQALGCER